MANGAAMSSSSSRTRSRAADPLSHMPLTPCPNLIGGEWSASAGASTPVYNPSTGEVIAACPAGDQAEVNAAVEAAAAAFPAWRETPAVERARVFFRYRQLIERDFDRLCRIVSREHGKTYAESRGDVARV